MGIYACGESVSRHNSSELVVLFSLKQEASASIGGGTFTLLQAFAALCPLKSPRNEYQGLAEHLLWQP